METVIAFFFSLQCTFVIWHCFLLQHNVSQHKERVALHFTPSSGGSEVGKMCSVVGLVWISSKPWMNPSDGSMSDVVGESEACSSAGGSLGVSVAGAGPVSEVGLNSSVSTAGIVATQSSTLSCKVGSPFTVSATSLSFSEGGLVLVGVHSPSLAERPLKPSSSGPPVSPQVEPSLSTPRSFWWIRWCRTKLCFRVKVRSQV